MDFRNGTQMVDRSALFRSLKYEVMKVLILEAFLTGTIAFFITHIILSLFGLRFYLALAVALGSFTFHLLRKMRKVRLLHIEKHNPSIDFMLRTAADYKKDEGFLSLALYEELLGKLKHVSIGTILNKKRTIGKIAVIIFLTFANIFVASQDIDTKTFQEPFEELYRAFGRTAALPFYGIEFNESDDIYGDRDVAQLGMDNIQMNISRSINEINLNTVGELEDEVFEEGTFPSAVYARADAPSDENLPKESDLAIAYNLKLHELEN